MTVQMMQLGTRLELSPSNEPGSDDAVRNSLGVCRELAEGIGSLPIWRNGAHRKKTEILRKIVGGSRKACS
ncbi:hypothetical protein BHM03_00060957, partial [Ensete ventricosum]